MFLNESITAEEFEKDLEAEAERSKVTGEGMVEDVFGTQISEMEVDDAGEDKVVVEDKGRKETGAIFAPKTLKEVSLCINNHRLKVHSHREGR